MYTSFFGLRENPFAITPDPRYLFMSERHREALAHLLFGATDGGGFVQLTGEVGTGKTTVTRAFLEQLPEQVDAALILNPKLSSLELLETITEELGLSMPGEPTTKRLVALLNEHLLEAYARGRRTVVVIDEAQNLSVDVLEQVRLLTNLETHRHKLLQIFLVGQPELRALLAKDEMRQLAQRITARYHLEPLNERETTEYIHHRLRVAGGSEGIFPPAAVRLIFEASGGIPRLINVICDRALLGAYASDRRQVTTGTVRMAAREIAGERHHAAPRRRLDWRVALPAALAGAVAASAVLIGQPHLEKATTAQPAAAAAPVTVAPLPVIRAPERPPLPLVTRAVAEGRLLAAWGLASGPDELCLRVVAEGLRCYAGRATLQQLRQIDRPAMVKLWDAGREGHAVLVGADADNVRLDLGGEVKEMPAAGLEPLLTGEFLLLWRPPVDPKAIRTGARGEPVAWLRDALARVDGTRLPTDPDPALDAPLQERVRSFQRVRGLHVDGIVGEQTLLHLSTAVDSPPGPRLTQPEAR